jgi:hypothetical protein
MIIYLYIGKNVMHATIIISIYKEFCIHINIEFTNKQLL